MNETKDFQKLLLDDILNDMRIERKFLKRICVFLCAFIVLLICGIIGTNIYYQEKIFNFMNQTDVLSSIEVNSEDSTNYGTISVK